MRQGIWEERRIFEGVCTTVVVCVLTQEGEGGGAEERDGRSSNICAR